MRTAWHHLGGSARGPVMQAAPASRLLAGVLVFAACMVAPIATWPGAVLVAVLLAGWLLFCRPPWRLVRVAVLFGLLLFLPYFLLVPWIPVAPGAAWHQRLLIPATVVGRGLGGLLASLGTASALGASDLREALARLPVPRMVSAILLQIVHQAATLFYETRRVAAAMKVRGAAGSGPAAWRALANLPRVWLPRVLERADRVAAAMELRGTCDRDLGALHKVAWRRTDLLTLAPAALALVGAVVLRVKA